MLSRLILLLAVVMAPMAFAWAEDRVSPKTEFEFPAGIWSGRHAMDDIAAQLSFGPRVLDTAGHEKTVQYIEGELAATKAATIKGQQWIDTGDHALRGWAHTVGGAQHALVNIVARFYPDNPRRIIVGTHYDSLVRAYRDQGHPDTPMPGANNSASGVALLLETARTLGSLPAPPVGIDFVFFDGGQGAKSLGANDPQGHPLGSSYFAQHLEDFYAGDKPEQAILFDMVCTKNLELSPEPLSLTLAKPEAEKFWRIGATLAPAVFRQDPYASTINNDHDALIKAGIPAFLVIDHKNEPWLNASADTLDKCSAASLQAVGRTLLQYIYAM